MGTHAGGVKDWRAPTTGTLATLLLLAVAGVAATLNATSWMQAVAIWPVGLATGATVIAPRRWRPVVVLTAGCIAAGASLLLTDQGAAAVGFGVSTALQASIGTALLTPGARASTHPRLASLGDLRRWLLSGFVGPFVGVGVFVAMLFASGTEVRASAAALVFLSSALSQLVMVLPFLRTQTDSERVSDIERAAQWTSVAVATICVFGLQTNVAGAFLLIPLLAWGAVRMPLREMTTQMVGTTLAVLALSVAGVGPFDYGASVSTTAVIDAAQLQLFLLSSVLLVVPYTLIAQQLRERSAQSERDRELVRRIMDSATRTAIIAIDRNGSITSFNRGAENLLGFSAEQLLGRTVDVLVPPEEMHHQATAAAVAPDFHLIARALTEASGEPRDWRLRRATGEVRTHSLTITPMSDRNGATVGYVCTSEDVTARVQRQEALLAALITEREAVERLEQADRMKDALVSTVSHELRTPLTSVLGFTAMLADGDFGPLPSDAGETLRRILANGERMRALVEDLLVLSRANSRQLDLAGAVVDLRRVVRTAHDVLTPVLRSRDLVVRFELSPHSALVSGDESMLERVMLNLLSNAVKFTPDGGRIDVTVGVKSDEVVVEVSDTGHGIPVDEQDQLFHQFFRSSIAKREAIQGTGLGLSIAQAIVRQHGGVIGATSEPGSGSTFLMVLPRLSDEGGHALNQAERPLTCDPAG